jgi:thiol:disulfide interchange protein DsbD
MMIHSLRFLLLLLTILVYPQTGLSVAASDLLPAEQAFPLSAVLSGDSLRLDWRIAPGYYLYRDKFRISVTTPGVSLGEIHYPKGLMKQDEFFGEMEIYRDTVALTARLQGATPLPGTISLSVGVQGCADVGVCYPPYKQTLAVPTGLTAPPAATSNFNALLKSLGRRGGTPDLLPAEQAFAFNAEATDTGMLALSWRIADGYYLYRDKIQIALHAATGTPVESGPYLLPHGTVHEDAEFGQVEILRGDVQVRVPLTWPVDGSALELEARFQGCADRGVCYPPMQQKATLNRPVVSPPKPAVKVSEQDRIARALGHDSWLVTALSFLGFGLLLSFTPCVFPMIPILSGIIVGHGHRITAYRGFLLSLAYVLASALTYTVFGVLAGLFGQNLQALFQDPRIIVAFSSLFVLLALSMFDLYTLQMPAFIQDRLAGWSQKQGSGTLTGAFIMGGLSALIVGPCVAAPLAGALIYIGQTGDVILGGLALFFLGIGMGVPLLAMGASAGKLLPRAGVWMNAVKSCFGVGLLATAVWLLSRIVPATVSLLLWGLLLIIPAIYLGALDPLPQPAGGWRKFFKGLGVVMLLYGIFLLIGSASNQTDPLAPLASVVANPAASPEKGSTWNKNDVSPLLPFRPVATVGDLLRELEGASRRNQWVMLDFYADWCVSCKELERYTFTHPGVRKALEEAVLLRADVTGNSEDDQLLLRRFGLIGPPAVLFFGPDKEERKGYRVIGFMEADEFLGHVEMVIKSCVQTC